MTEVKVGTKILCLFIAWLYFIFSCLYVTRCPNLNQTTNTKSDIESTSGTGELNNGSISKHKNDKSVPVAFLSRPRVIFSKNIFILLKAPSINLFFSPPKHLIYKSTLKGFCLANKLLCTSKALSIFQSWKI